MSPTQWRLVNELFAASLDVPASEREQFLARECQADPDLLKEVARLLFEHERTNGLLDRPLFAGQVKREDAWEGHVLNGRYQIERLLARGGMSSVYVAQDLRLAGRRVVVKFLHAWACQHPWLNRKFREEMAALALIEHPAVVGVLDTGEAAGGLPFLVIEYIEGATLRSAIDQGPLPLARAARMIREIGHAVAAAHAKGVLHRDLKPENIMLERPGTAEERVRLIDFSIARVEDADRVAATQHTRFAGTTAYMSPEQLRGEPVAASDIFALGVTACEMLTGRRPFAAASPVELYEQQRHGANLQALRQRRDIPERATRLIAKQLSFRPEDRSASALQAGEEIAEALLQPHGRSWPRRGFLFALGGTAAASAAGIYWRAARPGDSLDAAGRVIELPPAAEPLEHGFRALDTVDWRIVPNRDATGYEAVRVLSSDQGGYFHEMTKGQAAGARRGWKLIAEMAAEEGAACVALDFPGAPHRYSLNVLRNPGGPDTIRLVTRVTPTVEGIEWTLPGPAGARHEYVLILKAASDAADLWVDGVKRLTGYRGADDFRYKYGPTLAVFRYRSERASGVFWKFRLEIG